jgi:hypothetical protein
MLATFGFGITGILFFIFGLSIETMGSAKLKPIFRTYAQAYILVSYAFILWSFASSTDSSRLLAFSVVIGDILLAVASILMLSILLNNNPNKKAWLYVAGLIIVSLLVVRTGFFYPKPYMTDGILFFNSQRLVSFTIASTFLLVWLPANLYMSDMVTHKVQSLRYLYTFVYTAATLSAVIFLLAKAPLTVVLSFTAISISFLLLIISTRYVKSLEVAAHGAK